MSESYRREWAEVVSIIDGSPAGPTEVLTELYWTGVRAADPGRALTAALRELKDPKSEVWIIALGKAARPMAEAALAHLRTLGVEPGGGIVVGPEAGADLPPLGSFVGDHPLPGKGSFAAAAAIGDLSRRVPDDAEVSVLLSGGASSLVAGPVEGVSERDLAELYALLLTSGLDIAQMNSVRKRFSRWGAGRLAVALHPAKLRTFIVSDVIGDHIPSIGSGPCSPDEITAPEVRAFLKTSGLWEEIPVTLKDHLSRADETPKGGHPAFQGVENRIIVSNSLMLQAVARRAAELGLAPILAPEPLRGEAAEGGRMIAEALIHQHRPACMIWGGETVVRIDGPAGMGGRCQELALAAARELAGHTGITIIAAGTDGRDGPTDAAGAIVDGSTWPAAIAGGRNPEQDLSAHNSHQALATGHALFQTGLTGTNVMDVVIGLASKADG